MALFGVQVWRWIVAVEVTFHMPLTSLKNSSYSSRYGPNTSCCSINKSATLFLIATRFRHGKRQNWPNLVIQDFVDTFQAYFFHDFLISVAQVMPEILKQCQSPIMLTNVIKPKLNLYLKNIVKTNQLSI